MSSTSVATEELLDQRMDTIDRALMGLMPRRDRLRVLAEVETMVRDGSFRDAVLADENSAHRGPEGTTVVASRNGRRRSRLALTSGVMGIIALVLLFMMPITYLVISMLGEVIGG